METDSKTTETAGHDPAIVIPSREELLEKIVSNDLRWRYLHEELAVARAKTEAGRAEYLAEAALLDEETNCAKLKMARIRALIKRLNKKLADLSNSHARKRIAYHNRRSLARLHVSKHEKSVARQITKHNQVMHRMAEDAWLKASRQAYWSQRVSAGVMPNIPPPRGYSKRDEQHEKMIRDAADALAGRKTKNQNEPEERNIGTPDPAREDVVHPSEREAQVDKVQQPGGCDPGCEPESCA